MAARRRRREAGRPRSNHVFINCPFDPAYERLFIALVAGLTAYGRVPRCVLEVRPNRDRLTRLASVIEQCSLSVHDLSRVKRHRLHGHITPRLNMPFEFGLTLGVCGVRRHPFVVLEAKLGRLACSLSDMNGYDCIEVHGDTVRGMLQALSANPFATLRRCYRALRSTAAELREMTGAKSVYTPRMFAALATAGALHAVRTGARPD